MAPGQFEWIGKGALILPDARPAGKQIFTGLDLNQGGTPKDYASLKKN